MGGGEDGDLRRLVDDLAGERVHEPDALDGVAEELDPRDDLLVLGLDLQGVAANPEGSPVEHHLVSGELHRDELLDRIVEVDRAALLEGDDRLGVLGGRSETVDATHGGDHDDVAPLQKRVGRGVAEALDLLVRAGILLDVQVRAGDVRLRLVVVVVRDKVLDGVFGKKRPELLAELRRQGLVVREHERGASRPLDGGGHRVGLTGARRAQKGLKAVPRIQSIDETRDRVLLISAGAEVFGELERLLEGDDRHA